MIACTISCFPSAIKTKYPRILVEKVGFEPTTLCLQSRCSSQTELQPHIVRTTGLEPILREPKSLVLPITPCPNLRPLRGNEIRTRKIRFVSPSFTDGAFTLFRHIPVQRTLISYQKIQRTKKLLRFTTVRFINISVLCYTNLLISL